MDKIEEVVRSACNKEGIAKHCPERIAEALKAEGYCKASDLAKDIFDKLMKRMYSDHTYVGVWRGDILELAKQYGVEVKEGE